MFSCTSIPNQTENEQHAWEPNSGLRQRERESQNLAGMFFNSVLNLSILLTLMTGPANAKKQEPYVDDCDDVSNIYITPSLQALGSLPLLY